MKEQNEEKFSDDPIENLKIENELLRLKLDAQYGESFKMETDGNLPPEIENMFLNQVLKFEEQMQSQDKIRLQEKLGIEDQPLSTNLSEQEITERLENIEALMKEKNLFLDRVYGPYPDKEIYDFITLELFNHEVAQNGFSAEPISLEFPVGGESSTDDSSIENILDRFKEEEMREDDNDEENDTFEEEENVEDGVLESLNLNGWHFIYEEFRPNHKEDINEICKRFMNAYENQNTEAFDRYLADEVITGSKITFLKDAAISQLNDFLQSFISLDNFDFTISEINVQQNDKFMIGHCMGIIHFKAVIEDGEHLLYDSPFAFYMDYNGYSWEIFGLVIPGFDE